VQSLRRRARLAAAAASAVLIGAAGFVFASQANAQTDIVNIGEVQGSIADGDTDFRSPLAGQTVFVQGVVTQLTLDPAGNKGFFLQERADATDGDPNSSDGVFVFNNKFATLRTLNGSPAQSELGANWTVAVGDEIVVRGVVGSYFGNIQFSGGSTFVYDVVATGLDPLAEVATVEVDPPDDAKASTEYFRRHLGMQLTVPADSVVTAGRDVFSSGGEVWAMRGDSAAAQQDGYAARAFRDAHPLDTVEGHFDDGNGYLFVMGDLGIRATEGDTQSIIAPAKTYDVITEANTGGVYLSFAKYGIQVANDLALEGGLEPAGNVPVEPAGRNEASIASYNIENLYDFRDNPNSGCDFTGNTGCTDAEDPEGNVRPPFNYVPASYEEYEAQLRRQAGQIVDDLHSPAILMTQEGEAQDVCSVNPEWTKRSDLGIDRLVCDLVNTGDANTGGDGAPDSIQELALVIAEYGGPAYEAVGDLDSADTRGIMTGFLYQPKLAGLSKVKHWDPVFGDEPEVEYPTEADAINADVQNPKALNAALPQEVIDQCTNSGVYACNGFDVFSRPSQVAKFHLKDKWGFKASEIYLINNHFSSVPNTRVLHRTEQANYLSAISAAILGHDRKAKVLAGGDLNVFPRPDDPFAEGQTIAGDWVGPSDQLASLYEDSGLSSLHDVMLEEHPEAAYSYTFMGQTQTLDQMFVSPRLLREVEFAGSAHINADYPADAYEFGEEPAYGDYGVSDHDPSVITIDIR
jgi:predicted extracellular nuclease